MKKIRMLIIMVAVVIGLSIGSMAYALVVNTNFDVTATVNSVCNITNAPNLAFGVYDPTDVVDNDNQTTVTIRCTKGTTYELYITPATGARIMNTGPPVDPLNYELYTDAGRTTIFPDTAIGPKVASVSAVADIDTIVYGRIPALQDVAIGAYTQTVTVTVDYIEIRVSGSDDFDQ